MAEGRTASGADFRPILMAVGLVTVLRVIYLQYTPIGLYTDEAQYWLWSRTPEFGYFSKPPLIAWIVRASTNLCGNGEACVRGASPLLHGATALIIGLIGRDLGGARLAFWAAVTYATLPGVFYSATLITADVPLLFFWAVLIFALLRLVGSGAWGWAVLAGVAGGLGFLAKYAMLFALAGVAIAVLLIPSFRSSRMAARLVLAGAVATLIALPNILWNLGNDFSTLRHTADLAGLQGPPGVWSLAEFVGNQIAIFGPILSGALAWRLAASRREPFDERELLLLAFAVPVLLAMIGQSVVARAYGNWAAVAYVPLTLLVAAWLLHRERTRWLAVSAGLHIVLALGGLGAVAADTYSRERGGCGFAILDRHLGWDVAGTDLASRLAANPDWAVLSDDREVLAPLIYHARLARGHFAKWTPDQLPDDHYAFTARLTTFDPGPWLFPSMRGEPADIVARFENAKFVGRVTIPLGVCRARTINYYELAGFRGY